MSTYLDRPFVARAMVFCMEHDISLKAFKTLALTYAMEDAGFPEAIRRYEATRRAQQRAKRLARRRRYRQERLL